MPVESSDDRVAFLSEDDFGEEATYTPYGLAAVSGIAGIFDDPSLSVAMGEGAGVMDARPTYLCRSDDLPGTARGGDVGDTLALALTDTHPAVTYKVIDLQPDGQGMTLITLGAAS